MRSREPMNNSRFIPLLLSLLTTPLLAQSIDYDPRRDPELKPCDDHRYRGRAAEAKECYTRLLDASDNVLVGAESAWALSNMERANQLFRQAATANRRSVQARVRWGQLFLQTHQYADATTLFNEALQVF